MAKVVSLLWIVMIKSAVNRMVATNLHVRVQFLDYLLAQDYCSIDYIYFALYFIAESLASWCIHRILLKYATKIVAVTLFIPILGIISLRYKKANLYRKVTTNNPNASLYYTYVWQLCHKTVVLILFLIVVYAMRRRVFYQPNAMLALYVLSLLWFCVRPSVRLFAQKPVLYRNMQLNGWGSFLACRLLSACPTCCVKRIPVAQK